MSAAKRKTLATQQLKNALGARSTGDQAAALTAALEVINERWAWDGGLQQSLRQKYEELKTLSADARTTPVTTVPKPKAASGLARHNPLGQLNPYELLNEYGRDGLRPLLSGASARLLKQAADVVQTHEPGTKPASRSVKADMVNYIMEYVVGPGY
jgi:hypothetical protein